MSPFASHHFSIIPSFTWAWPCVRLMTNASNFFDAANSQWLLYGYNINCLYISKLTFTTNMLHVMTFTMGWMIHLNTKHIPLSCFCLYCVGFYTMHFKGYIPIVFMPVLHWILQSHGLQTVHWHLSYVQFWYIYSTSEVFLSFYVWYHRWTLTLWSLDDLNCILGK